MLRVLKRTAGASPAGTTRTAGPVSVRAGGAVIAAGLGLLGALGTATPAAASPIAATSALASPVSAPVPTSGLLAASGPVEPLSAQEPPPPGPTIDPVETEADKNEKQNKFIVGGIAVVLLLIVFQGRRMRNKRKPGG